MSSPSWSTRLQRSPLRSLGSVPEMKLVVKAGYLLHHRHCGVVLRPGQRSCQPAERVAARPQAQQLQTNPHLQPGLKRLPALAVSGAETGEEVKSCRSGRQQVEQPSLSGGRKVRELVEGLEPGAHAQKSGEPAITQETEERFEGHRSYYDLPLTDLRAVQKSRTAPVRDFGPAFHRAVYSSCRATMGSIRAARRAGIQLEPIAIRAIIPVMPVNTTGS